MLTVTKRPTPLSSFQPFNQVPFKFTADMNEVWQTTPTPAVYTLEIIGTAFTGSIVIDGITFVVNNTTDFTPTSFKMVGGDAEATLTNLVGALRSRPSFLQNWTWYISPTLTGRALTLVAKSSGYVAKECAATFSIAPTTDLLTPNVLGVMKPNMKFIYQLSVRDNFSPYLEHQCTELKFVEPKTFNNSDIEEIYVDFAKAVQAQLTLELIQLQCDLPVWNLSAGKLFTIMYGTSSTNFSGEQDNYLYEGAKFFGVYFNYDKLDSIEKYCRKDPNISMDKGRPFNQFFDLDKKVLAKDSVAWAYIYYNGIDYLQEPKPVEVKLVVEAIQINGLNTYGTLERRELIVDDLNSVKYGIAAMPIGMGNLGLSYVSPANQVLLTFKAEALMPNGSTQTIQLYQYKYNICTCCEDKYEFYFLSRTGAFETFVVTEDYEVIVETSQTEYQTYQVGRNFTTNDGQNVLDFIERNKRGSVVQSNSSSKKEIKFVFKGRSDKQLSEFIESFVLSEKRYMRLNYNSDTATLWVAPVTIKHSSLPMYKSNGILVQELIVVVDSKDLMSW